MQALYTPASASPAGCCLKLTWKVAMKKTPLRRSLENEVIVAVILLYLLLAVVMTAVHYIQPDGQETMTSSPSPSHAELKPEKN